MICAEQAWQEASLRSPRLLPVSSSVGLHCTVNMNKDFAPPKVAFAIKGWTAIYKDPIDVVTGERVDLGETDPEWPGWQWCTDRRGKSGWVPATYIEDSDGQTGRIVRNYVARELTIQSGEQLELLREESGWYWARNAAGDEGWAPGTHVRT